MKGRHVIYLLGATIWCSLQPARLFAQFQTLDNERILEIHNQKDTFFLSTQLISPGSFEFVSEHQPNSSAYHLEHPFFIWQERDPGSDSISYKVRFRVLPVRAYQWVSRFDSLLYQDGSLRAMESITINPIGSTVPIFANYGIQYDGSFARGLSVGNRQDLVLNSNFDLRMSGSLGDGIEIRTALSDNSIPLQPDGNTQQLQEFDKVFIQLTKDNNTLVGGDYEIGRPRSYFTNYFKKTQGVKVTNRTLVKPSQVLTTSLGLGSSRGKFARYMVPVSEGNQGPYRLPGNEGERFIIILAGTERIFLDGKLLSRGLERDYVIDYNSGELTFTANRMITKDSRIIAEYEYSVKNYNRSIYTFDTELKTRKSNLYFNMVSEQDGRLTGGLIELTPEDRRFLADLGDSTQRALSSTIRLREEGYDASVIMYALIDTLGYSDVLIRSTDPALAKYTARFSLVGQGAGDYIRVASESNGEVYAWVAPDSLGRSRGSHSPVAPLVAPQQRQMFALGGTYNWGKHGSMASEVSISRLDLNRFSDRDSEDDIGYAIRNEVKRTIFLQSDSAQAPWQIRTSASHEMLSSNFNPINPYRVAEFARDWNLTGLTQEFEHWLSGSIALVKPGTFDFDYSYSGFDRRDIYKGQKHVTRLQYRQNGLELHAVADILRSRSGGEVATFVRPNIELSQQLGKDGKWRIGFRFEEEKNARLISGFDTLSRASFYFDQARLYLRRQTGQNLSTELYYQKRYDYLSSHDQFLVSTVADDVGLRTRWAQSNSSILDATITLRELDIRRSLPGLPLGGLTYVSKINHQFNLWKGALRTTTAYEIGSGQEPKRTYQYLKVDPGLGVYTFLDLNDDGIQQINEFEIAPFPEQANYVRVTILTDEFIATNNVMYNQSYSVDPRRTMKNKKAFLAKWSDQGSIRVTRKNLQNADVSIFNPFTFDIADSSLVSVNAQIRNVLYFNRSNPKFDIQYESNDFRSRVVLTTGYESKRLVRHILRSRINFNQQFSGLFSISTDRNDQDSEMFDNKDFIIEGRELEPQLTWQPSSKFRMISRYRYAGRNNVLVEDEQGAQIHALYSECAYSKVSTSTLRSSISMVRIDFNGPKNGALEFTMLEGLKDGVNWLWGLSYDRRLANNIRINISYDGRKSGEAKVVHTARAQVSAFF